MKNFLTRKRAVLFSLIIALCLCSALFVASLGVKAKAEATTTYDVTGITVSSTAGDDNAIYADATVPENVDKTWGINYQGNATLNGEAKTINLRVIGASSPNLYFVDIEAKEGDILIVGGTYSMSGIDSTIYNGTTQLGDYALNLEQTAFKNYGNGVWDVVSDATSYDVVPLKKADIACSASNFYADSVALDNNAIVNSWHNQYKGVAKKNGKATWVTFRFVEEDRLWFENLNAADDDVFNFGGVYSAIPLDSDATVTRGQYLINLSDISFKWSGSDWVLIEPEKATVDEAFEDSVILDADYTNVWLTIDGVKQTSVALDTIWGIFSGATGSTKVIFTNNAVQSGGTIRVDLAKKYKASNYSALRVRMVVGSWNSTTNTVVTSAYATSDTAFGSIAGSVETKDNANEEVILEVDASKIADADGYIDSFVLKRVGPSGQIYFDYVELVPAKGKVDDMPEENVFLDANGEDMWLIGNYIDIKDNTYNGNWWGCFTPSDKNAKVSFPANDVEEGETIKVVLAKRYKADNLFKITVKIIVGNAVNVTTSAYATADSTEVAGSVLTTKDTEAVLLEIDPQKVADENGYVDSFVIKRAGGEGETEAERAGQLFFDYVELIPFDPMSEDKYVATGYFGGVANENANWTKKLESVNGWNDKTEGVNMSYPINIEADKDAKNGYAFKMYFHSWYGTMSSNAIIFKRPVTKEEAKAGLVIRIKAHLSPNGATYNTELGGIRLHGLDSTGKEGDGYMIPATITQDKFVLLALSGDEAEKLLSSDGKIYGIQIGSAEQVNDANANSFYQAYKGDGPNGCVAYIEIDYIELRKEVTITYYNATESGETETGKALTGLGSETLYKNPKGGATKKFLGWVKGSDASARSFDNFYDFSSDLDEDVNLYGWWIDVATGSDYYGVYKTADGKEVVIYSQGIELKGYADYENTILSNDGKLYVRRKVGSEILDLSDSSAFTKSKVVEITFYAFGKKVALKAFRENDAINYTFEPDGYTFNKWTTEDDEEVTTANETIVALYAVCTRVEISADEYTEYLGKYVNRKNGDLLELKADHVATLTLADGTTKNITYYLLENGGFAYIDGEKEIPCTFNANRVLVGDTEYAKLTSYTVTFYVDGTVSLTVTVNSGDYKVSAPETAPAKDGFEFVGWYTAMSGEEKYDFGSLVYKDISLYASFKKVETPDDSGKDSGNDGGCSGSVSGMSGLCALAFVGVAFAISKKKQKKD